MKLTVKDIINLELLGEFRLLNETTSLSKTVDSASLIEVPDYKNYMVPHSILISTLMQMKQDIEFFKEFILECKAADISALVIKDKGQLDFINEDIIQLARRLDVTIIILKSDCNLSTVLGNISNLIYSSQMALEPSVNEYSYAEKFSNVWDFQTLLEAVRQLADFEICIEFSDDTLLYSSKKIVQTLKHNRSIHQKNLTRIGDRVVLKNEVLHNDDLYCTFYLDAPVQKQISAFHLCEYIQFLVLRIKAEHELGLEQNQIELEKFIKNLGIYANINSTLFSVQNPVNFPLLVLFYKINQDGSFATRQIGVLKRHIAEYFKTDESSIKGFNTSKYTIFILECTHPIDAETDFYALVQNTFLSIQDFYTRIYCSKIINTADELKSAYFDSLSLISMVENTQINQPSLNLNDFSTLNLIKDLDRKTLIEFMREHLGALFAYKETNEELLETLAALIRTNFQLKVCANRLFIHYNTLRYRVDQLQKLGFNIRDVNFNATDVSIAITIYYFVYLNAE